jgi:hypothetical protein
LKHKIFNLRVIVNWHIVHAVLWVYPDFPTVFR